METRLKRALCLPLFFLFFLTYAEGKGTIINGNIKNADSYKWVYLYEYLGSEFFKVDSAKLASGKFTFKFKSLPRGFYKIGVSNDESFTLILGHEKINVETDLKDISRSLVISNSQENDTYKKFLEFNEKHNQEVGKLDQLAQPVIAEKYSNPQKFNTEIGKLQNKLDSLNKELYTFYKGIEKTHSGLLAAKVAGIFAIPDTTKKESFFTEKELKDEELTRGDILSSKIMWYMQKFYTPETWQQEGVNVINIAPANSKHREVFYITFIKLFVPVDLKYAKNLAATYKKEFPVSIIAEKLWKSIPKGAPEVGEHAPDIQLPDPEGKLVSLSSYQGKIVLLDFWASWCGPCRRENPNVVRVYEKYKDKGFTIFSISLDNNKENWVQAIKKDNLTWNAHVSDLKGWKSSAAALYQVRGIPATFLLDREGKVIATNLRGESLEKAIEELCR